MQIKLIITKTNNKGYIVEYGELLNVFSRFYEMYDFLEETFQENQEKLRMNLSPAPSSDDDIPF